MKTPVKDGDNKKREGENANAKSGNEDLNDNGTPKQ